MDSYSLRGRRDFTSHYPLSFPPSSSPPSSPPPSPSSYPLPSAPPHPQLPLYPTGPPSEPLLPAFPTSQGFKHRSRPSSSPYSASHRYPSYPSLLSPSSSRSSPPLSPFQLPPSSLSLPTPPSLFPSSHSGKTNATASRPQLSLHPIDPPSEPLPPASPASQTLKHRLRLQKLAAPEPSKAARQSRQLAPRTDLPAKQALGQSRAFNNMVQRRVRQSILEGTARRESAQVPTGSLRRQGQRTMFGQL
jgi:hypothetical protein